MASLYTKYYTQQKSFKNETKIKIFLDKLKRNSLIFVNKASINKFQRSEIIQATFSNHNAIRLKLY